MLVFALLNPIKATVGNLFVAMGQPVQLVKTRSLQLGVLVVGLFGLGYPLGNAGVALVVDVMLAAGIAVLFYRARAHVDFSVRRLLLAPSVALAAGLAGAYLVGRALLAPLRDALSGAVKIACFAMPYLVVLFLMERRQSLEMAAYVAQQIGDRLPCQATARQRTKEHDDQVTARHRRP
jgi:hypothetical protein